MGLALVSSIFLIDDAGFFRLYFENENGIRNDSSRLLMDQVFETPISVKLIRANCDPAGGGKVYLYVSDVDVLYPKVLWFYQM